jgi:hypothetical protein
MEKSTNLHSRCHVNQNSNESFVGIKADSEEVKVCFPLGYNLPTDEQDLRRDILHLISVLSEFNERKEDVMATQGLETAQQVDFPMQAYIEVINYFMEQNAYYTEKEPKYKNGDRGKIAWSRTLRTKRPLIQSNGIPAYTDYIVRCLSPNDKNMITQIHKYCVYESFSKIGWLFTPYLPEQPTIPRNDKMFLMVLREKLANTYNDKDKRLFSAMVAMIEFIDVKTTNRQFYFGTNRFEYVWEKLINRVFGIKNKSDYYPHTYWNIRGGRRRKNAALEPDTIMIYEGKIYVIDAKYYKFGVTGDSGDMPESSDISKQITYGEYVYNKVCSKSENGNNPLVYNAFLVPFASGEENNSFMSQEVMLNAGEAISDWKENEFEYERVQGILIDTRYLMYHYVGKTTKQMEMLAEIIEERGNV